MKTNRTASLRSKGAHLVTTSIRLVEDFSLSSPRHVLSMRAAPVAQTCSLLYRRFLTCHLPAASKRSADYKSAIRQIKPNFVVDLCRNTLSKFR